MLTLKVSIKLADEDDEAIGTVAAVTRESTVIVAMVEQDDIAASLEQVRMRLQTMVAEVEKEMQDQLALGIENVKRMTQ